MNNLKGWKKAYEKGMTLLEIMIVLAILAGIAGILVNKATQGLKKANVKQARILIGEVEKSLGMYYQDCRKFPTALNDLLEKPEDCQNWGPDPYVKKSQLQDPWGNELLYEKTSKGGVILSFGADGKEGGEGEDADISSEEL